MGLRKPKRYENPAYLDYVRSQPCVACGWSAGVDAHHVISRGAGGSDLTAIALCRPHHAEIHTLGIAGAEERWRRNLLSERVALLEGFIEHLEAQRCQSLR